VERFLTISEFMQVAQIRRTAVYTWIASGKLREGVHFVYLGSRLRFPYPQALEAIVEDSRTAAEAKRAPGTPSPSQGKARPAHAGQRSRGKIGTDSPINPEWLS
jgi:hypothetical protein